MRGSIALLALCSLVFACGETEDRDGALEQDTADMIADTGLPAPGSTAVGDSARADIVDAHGVGIGAVIVTAQDGGVALRGALISLPPGEHGFHIHQTGGCEPPISESAGSHEAPDGNPHGFDVAGGPHAGDLRNLVVAADSTATVDQANERVTLRGGDVELLDGDGSALVIHAGPDDYTTQPSGGSGEPIACGVIEGD
ncbi:MAG: superoxide dismutase family protein [Gemmatimonadota bacterium]